MQNNTKSKILDAALVSFATNGYKGTNLRDLAASLGITKSALYKHYDSKEAIWNAVIDSMEAYYSEHFGNLQSLPKIPESGEELFALSMKMLNFTLHDPKIILTRRLLLTEQFRDERAKSLATRHFLTATTELYSTVFAEMMKKGVLKQDDPEQLAFAYTAPISVLVQLCDREPEQEKEVMARIEAFIRHFISVYGKE